ncbi:hypothetical protein FBUS_08687 [Fasciolopsis buskii]|uniref:POU domain protein n=1 Tax=Fasciolopsis buskii TaxID=27845 RepID=A0A8E0RXS8_9TREM|nr:hypothetical protein FBUS_08687 [Fasciolopsis buski]
MYDPIKGPFAAYITFINDSGCKIHVPVPPSNRRDLLKQPDALFIEELNKQLGKECQNMDPEYSPLFKPDSEFALKVRVHPHYRTLSTPAKPGKRLRSSEVDKLIDSPPLAKEETDVELSMDLDLNSPQQLVEAFIARRNELNFCQRDVALSLKLLYNIDRSSTFIQRFETMALSVSNFAVVGPVIRQWLKDTESMESRDGIIRKVAEYNTSLPLRTIPSSEPLSSCVTLSKRRTRTRMTENMRRILEETFSKNPIPSRTIRNALAQELDLDSETVRVWFCNRRRRRQ